MTGRSIARALALTSVMGWCAACDVILGIHDVPDLGDVEAGAPPDSAGIGDVEASVPLAACGTGFVCTAEIPDGWSGPVAFATSGGSGSPSCLGSYGTAGPMGHSGPIAPVAACTCTCAGTVAPTCPDPVVSIYDLNATCSGSPTSSGAVTPSTCDSFVSGHSVSALQGAATSFASCGAPTIAATVPPLTWTNSYAVCTGSGPSDAGSCPAGTFCVESPEGQFLTKPCVYQAGDVPCAAGPYVQKTTFTTTVSDTRGCSTCSCVAKGGGCSGTVEVYGQGSCGNTATQYPTDGSCVVVPNNASLKLDPVVATPASCVGSAGAPVGGVDASTPVTVCCQP